ncbi:hypothetical protein JHK86_055916 [Glycine max]|nr:hypothetical protein JHK86_055916 [Glycine max]
MKTANDAVLLAIKTVSVLKSEMHRTFIDRLNDGRKEASSSEINKILESYIEAGIGFGAAYNIKSSILQSIFDSPFLGVGLKIEVPLISMEVTLFVNVVTELRILEIEHDLSTCDY